MAPTAIPWFRSWRNTVRTVTHKAPDSMKDHKDLRQDETLLVALEQLGKALDMMQSLFARIEDHVNEATTEPEEQDSRRAPLTPDMPDSTTIH